MPPPADGNRQPATNESITIEPYKLSEIFSIVPEFDGNPIFLQTFINACVHAQGMAVDDQRTLLTLHIKNKLRGKAAEIVNSRNPNTWPEIKSLLDAHFGDSRDLTSLIHDLQRIYQLNNESALTFVSRLQTHNAKMHAAVQKQSLTLEEKTAQSDLIETMTLTTLLTGLEHKLGQIIRAGNPADMLDAINRIKRELQLSYFEAQKFHTKTINKSPTQNQQRRPNNTISFCSFCKRNGHSFHECRARQQSPQQLQHSNFRPNYHNQTQFSRPTSQNFPSSNFSNFQRNYSPQQNFSQPSTSQQQFNRPSVIRPNPNYQQRSSTNQPNSNFNRPNPQRTHHVNFDGQDCQNYDCNFDNQQFNDQHPQNYSNSYEQENNQTFTEENYTVNSPNDSSFNNYQQPVYEDYTGNQDFYAGQEYPTDTPTQTDTQIDELSHQVQTMNVHDNFDPNLNFPEQRFM